MRKTTSPLLVLLTLLGCGSVDVNGLDPAAFPGPGACEGGTASFATDVIPIFSQDFGGVSCSDVGCHDQTATGRVRFDPALGVDGVYDSIQENDVLNLDDPASSDLLLRPTGQHPGGHTGGTLFDKSSSPEYQAIYCWINSGAENN